MTRSFAELEISAAAFDEIAEKLTKNGYRVTFVLTSDGPIIDMEGIGLRRAKPPDVSESFGIQPRSARLSGEP